MCRDFCSLLIWELNSSRLLLWRILGCGMCQLCGQTNLQTLQSEVEHVRVAYCSAGRQISAWLHGVTFKDSDRMCADFGHSSVESHRCCGIVVDIFTRLYTSECHTLVDISSSEDEQIQCSDLLKKIKLCPTFGRKYHHQIYQGKGVPSHAMNTYWEVEVWLHLLRT